MTDKTFTVLTGVQKKLRDNGDGTFSEMVAGLNMTTDSAGNLVDAAALSHTFGYDGSGNLITDTATDGTTTWVKTLTYTAGNLTGESKWVKQ